MHLIRCCIKKCNSELYGGISFHSLPAQEDLKQKWLDVVPVAQTIGKDSVVCSLHFKPDDFLVVNSRRMLKDDAVPSIFPVTCIVRVQRLPARKTIRAAKQLRHIVPASSKREVNHNRHLIIVKRDSSPVSEPPAADTQTSASDELNRFYVRSYEPGRDKKQNRHVIIVKRDWSPDNAQLTTDTRQSTIGDGKT